MVKLSIFGYLDQEIAKQLRKRPVTVSINFIFLSFGNSHHQIEIYF